MSTRILGSCESPNIYKYIGFAGINTPNTIDKPHYGIEIETSTQWSKLTKALGLPDDTAEFLDRTGWAPCADGSVTGVEYKSPLMRPETELSDEVVTHIDRSDRTETCGGHVHVFFPEMGREEIMKRLKPYVWLFACLYRKRHSSTYSSIHEDHDRKYCWMHSHHHGTVEIRIFDSPKNVKQMRFRMKLIDILLSMPAAQSFKQGIDQLFSNESFVKLLVSYMRPTTLRHMRMRVKHPDFITLAESKFFTYKYLENGQRVTGDWWMRGPEVRHPGYGFSTPEPAVPNTRVLQPWTKENSKWLHRAFWRTFRQHEIREVGPRKPLPYNVIKYCSKLNNDQDYDRVTGVYTPRLCMCEECVAEREANPPVFQSNLPLRDSNGRFISHSHIQTPVLANQVEDDYEDEEEGYDEDDDD